MDLVKREGDPYLTYPQYLYLDCRQDPQNSLLQNFLSYLHSSEIQLKELNWRKIEFIFPINYPDFESKLTSFGFTHCLNTWQLESANFPQYPSDSPYISSPAITYPELQTVLSQQADYHHQLYPEYYQDWANINKLNYSQYVNTDVFSSRSFYLVYRPTQSQIAGLILGGIDNDLTKIWEWVVDDQHRGKGIGSLLLHQYLYLCLSKGIKIAEVETGNLQPAAKIYQKFGFTTKYQTWYKNYI